jgi:hypothetical protein
MTANRKSNRRSKANADTGQEGSDTTHAAAGSHPDVVIALLGALMDAEPAVRAAAAKGLQGTAGSHPEVRSALLGALTDADPWVREAAARGLAEVGRHDPEVRRALLGARTDADPRVREAAAQSLAGVEESYPVMPRGIIGRTSGEQTPDQASTSEQRDQQQTSSRAGALHLRIMEDPLTAASVSVILQVLTRLHTKCWLMAQGRLDDLIRYCQTYDPSLEEEAHLVITKMRHNSPLEFDLGVGPKSIAEAMEIATQLRQRVRQRALENTQLEQKIEHEAQQVQAALADMEQAHRLAAEKAQIDRLQAEQALRLEAEKAELAHQQALLDLRMQEVALTQAQVAAQRAALALQGEMMNLALEFAGKMVDTMRPGCDPSTRGILIQTLLPQMLQLASGKEQLFMLPLAPPTDAASTGEPH